MKRPVIAVHKTDDNFKGSAYVFVDSIAAILTVDGDTIIKLLSGGTLEVDESADKVLKYIDNVLNNN